MGDDRPDVYEESGRIVYRANSFGGCTKNLAGLRMGYEPAKTPASMLAIFEAGNRFETIAIKRMAETKLEVSEQQREYDLQLTNRIIVRCHIDGRVADRVVEIKSQSQDAWDSFLKNGWDDGLWPKYRWQVSVEMYATGLKGLVVRINRDDESADMDYQVIDEPFFTLAELRARALEIEKIVYRGVLPEECDRPSFPCPLYRLHTDTLDVSVEVDEEEVDKLAREYDRARGMVKRWEGIKDGARRGLRLGTSDDNIRTRSGIVVKFSQATVRRLSEKKLKDAGINVSEYQDETLQERITVTMPKVDDD